ncbi:MAG: ribonuclease III [Deltaproteobacteria bacterium]|nr:ribonuclease III [Deltaproteobacteria bacterium]
MNEQDRIAKARKLVGEELSEELLLEALTHRARLRHAPKERSYERLEFLGDAVLDLIVAEVLLEIFPNADEGELTQRRAAFVSEPALAAAANACGLPPLIRLAKAQIVTGDVELPSISSDVIESLIAAVYLEKGLSAAKKTVERLLGKPPKMLPQASQDPKTTLQERLQALVGGLPLYDVNRDGGSEHAPIFLARVSFKHDLGSHVFGEGQGSNKKIATQAAAQVALEILDDKEEKDGKENTKAWLLHQEG